MLFRSNVNDGCFQSLMQFGNLNTHLASQLSIQVGQRLVHQEYLRATNRSEERRVGKEKEKKRNMREWLSGGAPPCQGGGRGFESRLALFFISAEALIYKDFRCFSI